MPAIVKPCRWGCTHAYQDRIHGPGQRAHNLRAKAEVWVCTVCKTEHSATKDEIKKATKS